MSSVVCTRKLPRLSL